MTCKVKILCAFCGKEILRYPSTVKERNFCSKECKDKHVSKTHQHPRGAEIVMQELSRCGQGACRFTQPKPISKNKPNASLFRILSMQKV